MEPHAKTTVLRREKSAFDGARRQCPEPLVCLTKLPDSPSQLQHEYPDMFRAAVVSSGPPAISRLDIPSVIDFDQSYGCRGGRPVSVPKSRTLQRQSSSSSAPVLNLSTRSADGMAAERFATHLLRQMEMMASSQQRMMELMMGHTSGVGVGRLPRCLEDRRPPSTQSTVALALPPPPPQLQLPPPPGPEPVVAPLEVTREPELAVMAAASSDSPPANCCGPAPAGTGSDRLSRSTRSRCGCARRAVGKLLLAPPPLRRREGA